SASRVTAGMFELGGSTRSAPPPRGKAASIAMATSASPTWSRPRASGRGRTRAGGKGAGMQKPSRSYPSTEARPLRGVAISCGLRATAVTMTRRMASRRTLASPRLAALVAFGLALAILRPATASTQAASNGIPAANVPVSAEAVVLLDLETGKVLFEKNAEGDRAPASLVKMMTLYIAYEELRAGNVAWAEPVTYGPNVKRTPRFRIGLVTGQVVPFETLLAAVAIASANDAATAVADRLAESEEKFVERMNAEAARLGLTHTVFANPHGLPDPRQRTTARDMATLAEALLRDFPESRILLRHTD